jgi:BatD DUF11 like domain
MVTCLQKGAAKLFILLVFTAALCSNTRLLAQAKFTVVCPQKKIGKNEYLQVQFKVENASSVESIIPPSFKNFLVVSGPNQESGMSTVNGKVDQYVAISYYLKPNTTGNFTIGPATAKADRKEFHSDPLNIQVTNASSSAGNNAPSPFQPFGNLGLDLSPAPSIHSFDDYILKKGENIHDKVQKNLFIKLDVNKASCYVGEPVVAAYKLYTRLRSETTLTNAPSFNGFSVSDLEVNDHNSAGIEKYNGREYNVYTLRKVQLYPLQPGVITLDPVETDNKVTFIKSEYADAQRSDMLYDMLQNFDDATSPADAMVEQHVALQSKPVDVTVKPLPAGMPLDFKGAVGNFTIQASLQKDNITTDDAGNLRIIIGGPGNIQLINAPRVNWPDGIDGYDPKITDDINKLSVPMKGNKTFLYPFTASRAGDYNIPAVAFSFFDPSTSTYKTAHTDPLTIHVAKGKGNTANPIIKNASAETDSPAGFPKYSGLYLALGVVLVAAAFFIFYQKRKTADKNKLAATAATEIKPLQQAYEPGLEFMIPANPLQEAHDRLAEEDSLGFYRVLDTAFKKYLAARFKLPANELSRKRLNEELDKCNVGLGTSLMLWSLMDEVELNLYTPPPNVNHLKEVYAKASEVVSLLDKQMC